MLEVFSRAGITDCVCVVTRYFGGVLLGTGGLVRAYTRSAKDALDAAGITVERLWDRLLVPCSYGQFEKVRQETQWHGGVIEDTDYGADIMLTVLTPEGSTQAYLEGLTGAFSRYHRRRKAGAGVPGCGGEGAGSDLSQRKIGYGIGVNNATYEKGVWL